MNILIIKTSSLGDLIHTFPAVTDTLRQGIHKRVDWVVERNFQEVPRWHPGITSVIPVDMRRWSKQPMSRQTWREWNAFVDRLRCNDYDVVLDAQGLIKSAWITRKARGAKYGLNWRSAWEPLASVVYDRKMSVVSSLHAIDRMRCLFGEAFDYQPPTDTLDYGLDSSRLACDLELPDEPYLVFAHATTWESKKWPVSYWEQLIDIAGQHSQKVLLPWGNDQEREAAENLAKGRAHAQVLERMSLTEIAYMISGAKAVVAVDTGLGHIASALEVPVVSLYGPTDPAQTGTLGPRSIILQSKFDCAPCEKALCQFKGQSIVKPACFAELDPQRVWSYVEQCLKGDWDGHRHIVNHHHNLQPA